MDEILVNISQYGVIPILLIVVYVQYRIYQRHIKEIKELNEELRENDKENISLLYKVLATLKKITGEDDKEK